MQLPRRICCVVVIAIGLTIGLEPGAASVARAAQPAHVPIPGWECSLGEPGGEESANFTIRADGRVHGGMLSVRARLPDYSLTVSVNATYVPPGERTSRAPSFLAGIARTVAMDPRRKPARSQLALTTLTGPMAFALAAIKGDEARGNHPNLHLGWGDLLAMANGADTLYLLRRDPKTGAVETQSIAAAEVRLLDRRLADLWVRIDDIAADPANTCHATQDIAPVLIL